MAAAKGTRPPNAGKGRKTGVKNKTTVAAREAFQMAFDGLGGHVQLAVWARENQTEFYKLFSKLIPIDAKVTLGGKVEVEWKSVESS